MIPVGGTKFTRIKESTCTVSVGIPDSQQRNYSQNSWHPLPTYAILLIFFCSLFLYAGTVFGASDDKENLPSPSEPSKDWISVAKQLGIELIDLRGREQKAPLISPVPPFATKDDFLRFLKDAQPNSAVIYRERGSIRVYLLPTGVKSDLLSRAKEIADDSTVFASVNRMGQLELVSTPIMEQPEVIALKTLTELEKGQDIHYQRFVNPSDLSSSYSFKIKYDARFDSLVPYERNGEAVSGRMEGFTSYASVYNFIAAHAESLAGQRSGEILYLMLNEDQASLMSLKGTAQKMEITSKARPKDGPSMDFRIVGNHASSESIARIQHDAGVVTLVDFIEGL